ncbi:MAG: hypothetical protein J7K90_07375 [Desulfuromusa sp.]|nr:hypothetical protein [Desulfuromusa sp.]
MINTFKHDSRAVAEQRLIDSITGLCRTSEAGFQAYIHIDIIDKFVGWLNDNEPKTGGDAGDISWKTIALDDEARLEFKESDNLYYLVIGRTKIGYAKGSKNQAFYQDLLNQAFRPTLT